MVQTITLEISNAEIVQLNCKFNFLYPQTHIIPWKYATVNKGMAVHMALEYVCSVARNHVTITLDVLSLILNINVRMRRFQDDEKTSKMQAM